MLVTLLGIITPANNEQPLNASAPMLVTPLGIIILVRLEQPLNILFGIPVKLLGRVT